MNNAPNQDSQDAPRRMSLCELIPALRLREGGALHLLERVDPVIFDMLHALAIHRGVETADLAADFLETLVIDAADAAWSIGLKRLSPFVPDPESTLLGSALDNAMEARLRRDVRISAKLPATVSTLGFIRSGWPYTQVY